MDPFPEILKNELELDDPALIHNWQMKSPIDQSANNSLSFTNPVYSETCSTCCLISATPEAPQTGFIRPSILRFCTSQQETFKKPSSSPPSSKLISFANLKNSSNCSSSLQQAEKPNFTCTTDQAEKFHLGMMDFSSTGSPAFFKEYPCGAMGCGQSVERAATRTPLQAQHHVLAERKRREKLSQRFTSLSALVPGLKKLDKSSVIDGTIKYMKQLEERLQTLEEGTKRKQDQEYSVVSEKKPRLRYHEEALSFGEDFNASSFDQSLTNIEVRISEGNVLVRGCCRRRNGFADGFINEMEKIDLIIKTSRFMPFGDSMLAIAAVAQINNGFSMTEEDLANSIRLSILKLII